MTMYQPLAGALALVFAAGLSAPAVAGPAAARPASAMELTVAVQDLGGGRGTLSTATAELRTITPVGAWSLAPTLGHRDQGGSVSTAAGAAIGWRRDWSHRIATSSELFVGEAGGPFAEASLAQALTARVRHSTTLTAALRWSRYAGGLDVWFASGEARRYFRRGSAAYRLTWIKPADRAGYASHLLSFTLNDPAGRGRTQLWLSEGQASLAPANAPDGFRGHDRALQLRRVQPLGPRLGLSLAGGLASYDLPGGAVTSRNVGLGLSLEF